MWKLAIALDSNMYIVPRPVIVYISDKWAVNRLSDIALYEAGIKDWKYSIKAS